VAESGEESQAARGRGGGSGHDRLKRKSIENMSREGINQETVSCQEIDTVIGF